MPPVRIAISLGDPSGIGPEVTVAALVGRDPVRGVVPVLVGDRRVVRRALRARGADVAALGGEVHHVALPGPLPRPGAPTLAGARASVAWFDHALDLVLTGGADALVTAPVSKGQIVAAGIPFVGHTERLAERCGTAAPVMMLAVAKLRVALATTHLPLRDVPRALTAAGIAERLVVTARDLATRFGIERPRLALAALNPHAGDGGAIGDEERRVLVPALERARAAGVLVEGPFPSDTLFARAVRGAYDAVLALYHDQGLIPIKLLGFERGVNVTLGTPCIRTSPDHGTAFDIAGRGVADPRSMREAIALAARLARGARRQPSAARSRSASRV